MDTKQLSTIFMCAAVGCGGAALIGVGYDAFGVNLAQAFAGVFGGAVPTVPQSWMEFWPQVPRLLFNTISGQWNPEDVKYAIKLGTVAFCVGGIATGVSSWAFGRMLPQPLFSLLRPRHR
ncbi:MAG TPA: hypothetical protein VIN59_00960 [Alphaproteobacteria bacterium]